MNDCNREPMDRYHVSDADYSTPTDMDYNAVTDDGNGEYPDIEDNVFATEEPVEALSSEWRNPPSNPIVEQVVGRLDLPPDDFEGYDERRQIAADVEGAIETMRSNMRKMAEAAQIKVTDEEVAAWQPGQVEIAKLRRDLTGLRQRANMIRGAETYLEDQVAQAAEDGIRLRPHQQDVTVGFRNFLVNAERTSPKGGKSGLIELPTGAGKTRVMVETASMIRHMQDPQEENRVIIITPTRKIQDQTVGADGKHGFGKFRPDEQVGRVDETVPDSKRAAELDKPIVSICLPSFLRLKAEGKLPPNVCAVLVDETHKAKGEKVGPEIEDYIADKIAVGFDATPEEDPEESTEEVTRYKIFKHQIAQMELVEAIQGGILTGVRAWVHHVSPVVKESTLPEDPAERRAAMREATVIAKERVATDIVKKELERGYREVPGKDGQPSRGFGVVVRCKPGDNVNYAYRFAKNLRGMFVKGPNGPFDMREIMPGFVGGDSKRQTQAEEDAVFEAFAHGKINVLANVKKAEVGWDDHGAKGFVNTWRGTWRELKQAIGRELRKMLDEDGNVIQGPDGKPIEAHLYDLVSDTEVSDPNRPTIVDILGIKSGDRIEADSRPDAPIPRPRTLAEGACKTVRPPDVIDVVSTTVGSTALEAVEVEVADVEEVESISIKATAEQTETKQPPENPYAPNGWPNQSGLDEFIEVFGLDYEVPLAEASRILGVSAVTTKGMMSRRHGDHSKPITLRDVQESIRQHTALQAPAVPATGYYEVGRKELSLRALAVKHGITLKRFTKEDGIIGSFLSDEEVRFLYFAGQ